MLDGWKGNKELNIVKPYHNAFRKLAVAYEKAVHNSNNEIMARVMFSLFVRVVIS